MIHKVQRIEVTEDTVNVFVTVQLPIEFINFTLTVDKSELEIVQQVIEESANG